MDKLSASEEHELVWFFGTPEPAQFAGHVAAQSYEPKGGGFDPSTNLKLEKMVFDAISRRPSEWDRVKSVLVHVGQQPGGLRHVEVLQSSFHPAYRVPSLDGAFEVPAVALMTATAASIGKALALEEEHYRRLEIAYSAARVHGLRGIAHAMRVVEADARTYEPDVDSVRAGVLRAVARAVRETERETLALIHGEEAELHSAAATAYQGARRALRASKEETAVQRQKKADAEWEAYITGKKAKSAARFASKLRSTS